MHYMHLAKLRRTRTLPYRAIIAPWAYQLPLQETSPLTLPGHWISCRVYENANEMHSRCKNSAVRVRRKFARFIVTFYILWGRFLPRIVQPYTYTKNLDIDRPMIIKYIPGINIHLMTGIIVEFFYNSTRVLMSKIGKIQLQTVP